MTNLFEFFFFNTLLGPLLGYWEVKEAQSDQTADHVKSKHPYNCFDCIL